jgi:hypothetical protein
MKTPIQYSTVILFDDDRKKRKGSEAMNEGRIKLGVRSTNLTVHYTVQLAHRCCFSDVVVFFV